MTEAQKSSSNSASNADAATMKVRKLENPFLIKLKETIDQKTLLINQLNEEIVSLKSSSQNVKKLEVPIE